MEHQKISQALQEKAVDAQKLIDELLKDSPNLQIVESLMKQFDLPFSQDPIERMNIVLQALHPADSADNMEQPQ